MACRMLVCVLRDEAFQYNNNEQRTQPNNLWVESSYSKRLYHTVPKMFNRHTIPFDRQQSNTTEVEKKKAAKCHKRQSGLGTLAHCTQTCIAVVYNSTLRKTWRQRCNQNLCEIAKENDIYALNAINTSSVVNVDEQINCDWVSDRVAHAHRWRPSKLHSAHQ